MNQFANVALVTLRWIVRDKVVHVVLSLGVLLLMMVPALSLFSLRQVQELSITLSLSAFSGTLFVVAILLGSSSIWRDVDRRYSASVLGLPISRATYVFGKFFGICLVLTIVSIVMASLSGIAIVVASAAQKSEVPINWKYICIAFAGHGLKATMVAAVALLLSSLSTSFFLPFLATFAIYISGNTAQEVFEYLSGEHSKTINPLTKIIATSTYYILPNFSAFDFNVYAIYGIATPRESLLLTLAYFLVYVSILLVGAAWIFSRRELA